MTRKTGLTKDQHLELGAALALANETISAAVVKVSAAYSVNGKEAKALENARQALDKARSVLDEAVCRELPLNDPDAARAYYPIQE